MNPSHVKVVALKKRRPETISRAKANDISLPQILNSPFNDKDDEFVNHGGSFEKQIINEHEKTIKREFDAGLSNRMRDLEILVYDIRGDLEKVQWPFQIKCY